MYTLLLVRHGETELKSSERYWGHTDVKLSKLGIQQAERLRDALAKERIDIAYSSNLQRALVTAEIIASKHGAEIIKCPELREISFGELEGLTFSEIAQRYPEVTKSWREGKVEFKYPGGESMGSLIRRVATFPQRLSNLEPEQTALIVAHSGSLRMLMCNLLGMEPQRWWQFRLDFTSLSILETNSRGAILMSLNNTCHLGGID